MVVVATSVATASTTVASAATATLAGDDVDECLNLLLGGIVHREYLAVKYEAHACVGVVEVDGHGLLLHLYHEAVHALAVGIDEGNHVAGVYLLVVKLTVDAEDVLVNVEDEVVAAVAIGLVLGEGELKGVALFQVLELLFESLEGEAEAGGELEGVFLSSLLYKLFHAFILGIHVIRYGNRLAGIDFCHGFLLYYILVTAKILQAERKNKFTCVFPRRSVSSGLAERKLKTVQNYNYAKF